MFLMWFDDNAKKPIATKLAEGAAAYQKHFGHACNVVIVNDADKDTPAPAGLTVKATAYVRRNNFWFGLEPHT
jgi:hypothetical protein